MTRRTYGQSCPVAHALDLVGERWTMLIVRDLVLGPARFGELRDQLAGIAPNLLAERLRFLGEQGLVEQVSEPGPPPHTVYQLTARGRELSPLVQELARVGLEAWDDPEAHPPHLTRGAVLALMMPERLGADGWAARLVLDGDPPALEVVVAPAGAGLLPGDERPLGRIRLRPVEPDEIGRAGAGAERGPEPAAIVRAGIATLVALRRGELTEAAARRRGRLVTDGDPATLDAVGRLLGWNQARRATPA